MRRCAGRHLRRLSCTWSRQIFRRVVGFYRRHDGDAGGVGCRWYMEGNCRAGAEPLASHFLFHGGATHRGLLQLPLLWSNFCFRPGKLGCRGGKHDPRTCHCRSIRPRPRRTSRYAQAQAVIGNAHRRPRFGGALCWQRADRGVCVGGVSYQLAQAPVVAADGPA